MIKQVIELIGKLPLSQREQMVDRFSPQIEQAGYVIKDVPFTQLKETNDLIISVQGLNGCYVKMFVKKEV